MWKTKKLWEIIHYIQLSSVYCYLYLGTGKESKDNQNGIVLGISSVLFNANSQLKLNCVMCSKE